MTDPITGAAISGVANVVGSTVVEKIVKGEDDHEVWRQQVVGTATEAEATRRYCIESTYAGPERSELERKMSELAKQARKLEVIGQRQEYPDQEVKLTQELSDTCSTYSLAPKGQDLDSEEKLSEDLPEIVDNIFTVVG